MRFRISQHAGATSNRSETSMGIAGRRWPNTNATFEVSAYCAATRNQRHQNTSRISQSGASAEESELVRKRRWGEAQNNLSSSCSCSYASDFSIDFVYSLPFWESNIVYINYKAFWIMLYWYIFIIRIQHKKEFPLAGAKWSNGMHCPYCV